MKSILDWAIKHLIRQYQALDRAERQPERAPAPAVKLHTTPSRARG